MKTRFVRLLIITLLLALLAGGTIAQEDDLNLHVESPDWSEQVIYFIMIDRFNDGNPDNNDQGADEYDPTDDRKFQGGDIQGIIDQLDYIQDLGATAIWITPPVANQWWDPVVSFGGYHGYWAEHFMEVDAHFGTLEDYKRLSDAVHDRGMYLIQDIVTNHTGNFFTYTQPDGGTVWNPDDPTEGFRLNMESVPVVRPSMPPFDMNDVTNPEHREAAIYNWTPPIEDYGNPIQQATWSLSDLDDLNDENPVVRDALREAYGFWIEEVGVDAFRVDTVLYMGHDFWHDFMYGDDADAPGILAAAEATGRDNFLAFGEAFRGSGMFDDSGDREVASYLGTDERPELNSMLNFPMHFTINRVFAEGAPTAAMTYRVQVGQEVFPDLRVIPNFIDNHDVARFLSKANSSALEQALTFLLTYPGIPVIYYGTEQGFVDGRPSMFAEGSGSGGEDHFDREAELYQTIDTLTDLRLENAVFTQGTVEVFADNEAGPGILGYRRDYQGETAVILMNTADNGILASDIALDLGPGATLTIIGGNTERSGEIAADRDGTLSLEMAPRETIIAMLEAGIYADTKPEAGQITIATTFDEVVTGDVTITGTVSQPGAALKLLLNGNLDNAIDFSADDAGSWEVVLPARLLPLGASTNTIQVYAPELGLYSAEVRFDAETEAVASGQEVIYYDYIGDDIGPAGEYEYPTDETFGEQLDILATRVTGLGSSLEIELTMAEITDVWTPQNGFDHVMFHVFIDLPGVEGGADFLPRINAPAPEGFAWDYMGFHEGWSNRLYSAAAATLDEYGTIVEPAAEITVDMEAGTITFLYDGAALGSPETLEGARIYITNWDWDGVQGNYRTLAQTPGQWNFSGGTGGEDPFIMDDTAVITLTEGTRVMTADLADDDNGPDGNYTYPTDASFGEQLDILEAGYTVLGSNLEVELTMAEVTDTWSPVNGFDHVLFHVFIDLPGVEGGATVLPRINADAPEGFAWDYMGFVEGWNNRLFSAEGASADEYGTSVTPVAEISVDKDAGTITLLFSGESLGNPETLAGTRIYITNWDWNGPESTYRGLTETAGQFSFGGGSSGDPLIMDSVFLGAPMEYALAEPEPVFVPITFVVTAIPENTPEGDDIFIVGPFNMNDPDASPLTLNDDGTYSITVELAVGETVQYRFTRGSFANQEIIDPTDRTAARELVVPDEATTVEVEIEGWFDIR